MFNMQFIRTAMLQNGIKPEEGGYFQSAVEEQLMRYTYSDGTGVPRGSRLNLLSPDQSMSQAQFYQLLETQRNMLTHQFLNISNSRKAQINHIASETARQIREKNRLESRAISQPYYLAC